MTVDDEYLAVIEKVNPLDPKYAPGAYGPGTTACNFFVHDVCTALGVELPRALAFDQIAYLDAAEHSVEGRLVKCDAVEAKQAANRGRLTLATWRNLIGAHSHIAVVVPSIAEEIHIAQAGLRCFVDEPLAHGFGSLPVRFFTYTGATHG